MHPHQQEQLFYCPNEKSTPRCDPCVCSVFVFNVRSKRATGMQWMVGFTENNPDRRIQSWNTRTHRPIAQVEPLLWCLGNNRRQTESLFERATSARGLHARAVPWVQKGRSLSMWALKVAESGAQCCEEWCMYSVL